MKPNRNSYTSLDFLNWNATGGLVIAPKFQRRGVWNSAKRSYLIDTMIHGLPVPPIYIRQRQDTAKTKTIREIIDGQQRISAVLDFLSNKYALSKSLEGPHAGKRFSKLAAESQDAIRDYSLNCETFDGIDDETVLEIFARMNTYSVQLNKQELRNGRYFGKFKQQVYRLALAHNSFWLKHKIVSNSGIARMNEAELVSELLIAQIAGQQDKKTSIDDYYEKYNDDFKDAKTHSQRFRSVADEIELVFADELKDLAWHRSPMFYTLYCVVYHRLYALPGETPLKGKRKSLTSEDRRRLFDACLKLSEALSDVTRKTTKKGKYAKFISASQSQTDNIKPRRERFLTLVKLAFHP